MQNIRPRLSVRLGMNPQAQASESLLKQAGSAGFRLLTPALAWWLQPHAGLIGRIIGMNG